MCFRKWPKTILLVLNYPMYDIEYVTMLVCEKRFCCVLQVKATTQNWVDFNFFIKNLQVSQYFIIQYKLFVERY